MKSRFQTVISERMTQSTELATDQAKPHQSWIAATGAATTFILFSFWMSYSTWGHDGLPIGWDTPRYVYQSAIVASKGPIFFIQYNGFYNVVYQLLSGFIVWLGLPPLAVEVYMPIFICCTLPFLLSWITAQHYNKNLAALVALSTPAWPAIYRIGADLHPNLLALCLLLAALSLLFSHPKNLEIVSGIALICLASFTHIETTLFFVGIIALMGLFQRNSGSLLTYLMPAIATIPAAILYLIHFTSQVLSYSGGSASFSPPLSTDGWFLELGPLIPLVAIGIAICVISRQYWLEKLVATWGISSIVIGLSQYLSGQTTIFAERAIFLFPVPLAAAIGFNKLRTWPQKVGSLHREPNVRTIVMGLLLLLLVASWPAAYLQIARADQRVFITPTAFERLQWIKTNLHFNATPIFVFNDFDSYAGAEADLHSNWVSVVVGPHLSYMGLVDYLMQLEQTPYNNLASRTFSGIFLNQMLNANITNTQTLLEHPLVIVDDFYYPSLPLYTLTYFDIVSDGIFVSNPTRLASLNNVTLPLGIVSSKLVGPWYTIQRDWAESGTVLECWDNATLVDYSATFQVEVAQSANYQLAFRYWNGSGNNVSISVDGNTVGRLLYEGAATPTVQVFPRMYLVAGPHSVTISVGKNPRTFQYASLDYMALIKP